MDFISTLVNYGALGVVLAYFIWKDNNTMKSLIQSLNSLQEMITIIRTEITTRNEKEK